MPYHPEGISKLLNESCAVHSCPLVCNKLFETLPFQLTLRKVFAMLNLREKYIKVVGALRGE